MGREGSDGKTVSIEAVETVQADAGIASMKNSEDTPGEKKARGVPIHIASGFNYDWQSRNHSKGYAPVTFPMSDISRFTVLAIRPEEQRGFSRQSSCV
jgi:hypothetical protein